MLIATAGRRTSQHGATAHRSPDPALRDIDDLMRRGLLAKEAAGGRSTSYALRAS